MANLKGTTIDDSGFLRFPQGTESQRPSSPNQGMVRFNADNNTTEIYDNVISEWITSSSRGIVATGGLVFDKQINGVPYRFHVFNNSGTSNFTVEKGTGKVEYLIVGAGGGGGGASESAGGGGAGAVRSGFTEVTNTTYTISVGSGGNGGAATNTPSSGNGGNGGSSSAFGVVSDGGGAGGTQNENGASGASGGGGGGFDGTEPDTNGGSPIDPNFGKSGGNVTSPSGDCGAGGGGVLSSGRGFAGNVSDLLIGGSGITNNILGYNIFFGGGGAGGSNTGATGGDLSADAFDGGIGGGGRGGDSGNRNTNIDGSGGTDNGRNGWPNSGSGGGGAGGSGSGGNGADGLVVVRYEKIGENSVPAYTVPATGIMLDLDFADAGVWSLNNNVIRNAANTSLQGTLEGGADSTRLEARNLGGYVSLDGSDDRIRIDHDGQLNFYDLDFSINMWLKQYATNEYPHLYTIDDQGNFTLKAVRGGLSNAYRLYVFQDSSILFNNSFLDIGNWQLITLVRQGNEHKLYLNGLLSDNVSNTPKNIQGNRAYIGEGNNGGEYSPQDRGAVTVFNRALSDTEVSDYWQATRWRFGV